MTVAAAAGAVAGVPLTVGSGGTADLLAADRPSFAQTLLDLLDRQLTLSQGDLRPFANGTMAPVADAFGAAGFFYGSAPLGPTGGPAIVPASILASAGSGRSDATRSAAPQQAEAPLAVASGAVTMTAAEGDAAPGTIGGAPAIPAGRDGTGPLQGPVAGNMPLSAMPPGGGAAGRPALAAGATDGKATLPRVRNATLPGRGDPGSVAGFSVGLARDGEGVAVSVVSDHREIGDGGMLHGAIAGLLARHGLVLSELRITRRAPAGNHSEREN